MGASPFTVSVVISQRSGAMQSRTVHKASSRRPMTAMRSRIVSPVVNGRFGTSRTSTVAGCHVGHSAGVVT